MLIISRCTDLWYTPYSIFAPDKSKVSPNNSSYEQIFENRTISTMLTGNNRRHIEIENWNEIIKYYQPYKWVIGLFKKYSDERKLGPDDSE